MHDLMTETEKFAVHVLARNQVRYGLHFAKPEKGDNQQFEDIPHEMDSRVRLSILFVVVIISFRYICLIEFFKHMPIHSNSTHIPSLIEGIPILRDTTAVMLCTKHSVHGVGDHNVWYGLVQHAYTNNCVQERQQPLLYYAK
jgi:flavin reductase (DIM6/NTAB) family NADH-FMN oxidoreductase RutF